MSNIISMARDLPAMFARDKPKAPMIEGGAIEREDDLEVDAQHVQRLRRIMEESETRAREALEKAAEHKKDFEEALAEFQAALKLRGLL